MSSAEILPRMLSNKAPCKLVAYTILYTYLFFALGFNDTSTLVGHFVLSLREKEKRHRGDSRGMKERDKE